MASKAGYEPIPDVEKAEGVANRNAKDQYQDLTDKETKLLLLLDRTIDEAGLHFSIPSVTPEELDFEAKGICYYAFAPTITAVCTLVAAFCLEKYAQVSDKNAALAKWGIALFPYINAGIVFISSTAPIQERLMRAIEPVFAQTEIARETLDTSIDNIPLKVDQRLDQIMALTNEVLEPLRPALSKAAKHSDHVQKIYPDFVDVPTPAEIEQDIEAAKGLVNDKVHQARMYIVVEDYIPRYMRSARSFYWRIVFPILALALVAQLVGAFASTCFLRSSEDGTASVRVLSEFTQEEQVIFESIEQETGQEFRQFKVEAEEAFDEFESTFVDEMKGLAIPVVLSYVTALLEMFLVYLLTCPKVHTMLVNAAMDRVEQEAERTLRQHGVSDQVIDVLETRMTTIRKKTLKLLGEKRNINEALFKIGDLEAIAGAMDVIASLDSPFKSDVDNVPNVGEKKAEGHRRGSPLRPIRRLFGKKK